jgi:hypothetical protein
MFKLLALLALFAVANSQLAGGWSTFNSDNVPTEFIDAAKWGIADYNSGLINGQHKIQKIINARSQVVAGLKLQFTILTSFESIDGKVEVSYHAKYYFLPVKSLLIYSIILF